MGRLDDITQPEWNMYALSDRMTVSCLFLSLLSPLNVPPPAIVNAVIVTVALRRS